jgi:hypothetical protein
MESTEAYNQLPPCFDSCGLWLSSSSVTLSNDDKPIEDKVIIGMNFCSDYDTCAKRKSIEMQEANQLETASQSQPV